MTIEVTISLMIDRIITNKTIGEIITDKTIEGTTKIDKILEQMTPNRDMGIRVRAEIDKEVTVVTILEVEIEIEMVRYSKEPEHYQMTEKGQDLGVGPTLE